MLREQNFERQFAIWLLIAITFLFVNLEPRAGLALFVLSIGYLISISSKYIHEVEIIKGRLNLANVIFIVAILVGSWYFISSYLISNASTLLQFLKLESVVDKNLFTMLAETTDTGVISGGKIMEFVIYGLLVPIAESLFFFSVVFIAWKKLFKQEITWNLSDYRTYWLAGVVGASVSLFHIFVRSSFDLSLITDFMFGFTSTLVVIKTRQLIEILIFHVILNTGVLYVKLGGFA